MKEKGIPVQVKKLLSLFDEDVLKGLSRIAQDKQMYHAIESALNTLHKHDRLAIMNGTAQVHSMDSLLSFGLDQSFYRGKIVFSEQFFKLILYASRYLDKKIEDTK